MSCSTRNLDLDATRRSRMATLDLAAGEPQLGYDEQPFIALVCDARAPHRRLAGIERAALSGAVPPDLAIG